MSKIILGLDMGSNSIGWALLKEQGGKASEIIALGSRIFTKAVEEKTPTAKNVARRNARLTRRVLQRRARRKAKMLNFLISLKLLPESLSNNSQPEIILNELGNPYQLRAKALDEPLNAFELGRVMLHLVQRRGFLSTRKSLLGDMVDDPDIKDVLEALEQADADSAKPVKGKATKKQEGEDEQDEGQFKADIQHLRKEIESLGFRTLGEYLASLSPEDCKRNRTLGGGHLRTDRQMYRDELALIFAEQEKHHSVLSSKVKNEIEAIIFTQRPLKLRKDRIGKCSLEKKYTRAKTARLECQRFRYLQQINNLQYEDYQSNQYVVLNAEQRQQLCELFEHKAAISYTDVKKQLGFKKIVKFNLEEGGQKLKGNTTACKIRKVLPSWDELTDSEQHALVEDLLTITKKSVLKNRLQGHWQFDLNATVELCLTEFEPGHSNHCNRAIQKMLPFLKQGQIYSDARVSAGYGNEQHTITVTEKLGKPPEIPNPIVSKALHELRRVINAIIVEYGKPDAIRVEMARDLEMNTKRYQEFIKQQKTNQTANEDAEKEFASLRQTEPHLGLSHYARKSDKLKYRLWKEQKQQCAYSNKKISLSELFSAAIEIDHILPYSQSLDDSYMNKVVCFTAENRFKGQRTPKDAFSGDKDKWHQITQASKTLHKAKRERFQKTDSDLQNRDFIETQLNDTRYISREAQHYLKQLGADISVSKGVTTAWLRHSWGLNSLLGDEENQTAADRAEKKRTDHRHHAIDAVVIACVDRSLYTILVNKAKDLEQRQSELKMRDIHIDPLWQNLREDLQQKLDGVIIAHCPQIKLSGELHEETGAGFIELKENVTGKIRLSGNVNRKNLNPDFTQVDKIIDPDLKDLVSQHLQNYGNNPKLAFAENIKVFHKDGITPIKRVRIQQSKTTLTKLEKTKFAVKDKQGKVFKWLAYGNLHHVEIIRHKQTGEYSGEFVTMMEASHRAKGINRPKQQIVKTEHGEDFEFLMALHINDLVSVEKQGKREYYRVQKLDSGSNRFVLRLHTTTTLDNKNEEIYFSINAKSFEVWKLQKHKVNALGKLI